MSHNRKSTKRGEAWPLSSSETNRDAEEIKDAERRRKNEEA